MTLIDYAHNKKEYHFVYFTKFNVSTSYTNLSSHNGGTLISVYIAPEPSFTLYSWNGDTNMSVLPSLPSVSGYHTLNVFTNDSDDNWYIDTFVFLTVLEVDLTNPLPDFPTQSNVSITFSFSEVPLTILYSWDFDQWSGVLKNIPSENGNHSLRVWVENSDTPSSQWFQYSFIIVVDNYPPKIMNISPSNNSRINADTIFSLSYDGSADSEFKWNHTTKWQSSAFIPLNTTDGIYSLSVRLTDLASNIVFYDFIYEYDRRPIIVHLFSPINGSEISSYNNSFNISFSEVPSEIVYWTSWTNVNQTSIPDLPFRNDSIIIIIYCSDGLNWVIHTYIFRVIHHMGVFVSVYPSNNSLVFLDQEILFTWSHSPKSLLWNWNGASNQSGICLPPNINGNHVLLVYYQDISGIWLNYSFYFSVDLSPPQLVSEYPLNGSVFDSKMTHINFTFDELIYFVSFQWSINTNLSISNLTDVPSHTVLIPIPSNTTNLELSLQIKDFSGNIASIEYMLDILDNPSNILFPFLFGSSLVTVLGSIVTFFYLRYIRK